MDPLADKFMIFAALIAILYSGFIFPKGDCSDSHIVKRVFLDVPYHYIQGTNGYPPPCGVGDANIVIPANRWGR